MDFRLTPVVRYWQQTPTQLKSELRKLKDAGARSVGAFVPWAHLNTDRHKKLQKFIRSVDAIGLQLKLCVTPELGTGYPNGGVPDNIQRKADYWAKDRFGQVYYNTAPPNMHPLVNLGHADVFQKYGHFLLKISQEISEILFEVDQLPIELIVSDSFFRHYAFTGGETEYQSAAFTETVFCDRSRDFLESKFSQFGNVRVRQLKMFSREASLGRLLEEASGGRPAFDSLARNMLQRSVVNQAVWFDDLARLDARERNFLLSASLVLYGDVFLPFEDYFACTAKFRKKLRAFTDDLSGRVNIWQPVCGLIKEMRQPPEIVNELHRRLNSALKMKTSFRDLHQYQLVVVDPDIKISMTELERFIDLVSDHEVTVAFHRESFEARAAHLMQAHRTFQITHEWAFEVALFAGAGKIVIYDEENRQKNACDKLAERLLSIAEVKPLCSIDHRDVASVCLEWDESDSMKTLFLLNISRDKREVDIKFARAVELIGMKVGRAADDRAAAMDGLEFSTELPPLSVVPMNIEQKVRRYDDIVARQQAEKDGDQGDRAPAELA